MYGIRGSGVQELRQTETAVHGPSFHVLANSSIAIIVSVELR